MAWSGAGSRSRSPGSYLATTALRVRRERRRLPVGERPTRQDAPAGSYQDRFARLLLEQLHSHPWNYQRDTRPAIARTGLSMPSR